MKIVSDRLEDFVIFNLLFSIFIYKASMSRLTEQTEHRFLQVKGLGKKWNEPLKNCLKNSFQKFMQQF